MVKAPTNTTRRKRINQPSGVVGWRELVMLQDLCPLPIKAKIDTGARTSAIHAWKIRKFKKDNEDWVKFELHPHQKSSKDVSVCEAKIHSVKSIKSSNGQSEDRYTILTRMTMGSFSYPVELTLTNRDEMGYRLLIGRTALRHKFIVDCSHSYIQASPKTFKRKAS